MKYNIQVITKRIYLLMICALALSAPVAASPLPDTDYDKGEEYLEAGEYLQAMKAFGRAAKNGNTDAQYQIGIMFLEGQGLAANPEDAAYWFRKAAQNGHMGAQFEIGYCFQNGIGVQADRRIAAEWFWRAAEQGDPDAAFYLARIYRDGDGMPKNLEKARKYFKKAAAAGIEEAQQELDKLPAERHKTSRKASTSKSISALKGNKAQTKKGKKGK